MKSALPVDQPLSCSVIIPVHNGAGTLGRCLDALAAQTGAPGLETMVVDDSSTLSTVFDEVSHPVTHDGHRSRAIRIGDRDDIALLQTISRGEFATAGFRNRDLQRLLHPVRRDPSVVARRRLSSKIGRQLRLLRAHGIIRKVQKSHRYVLTQKGHLLSAALFAARGATTKQLLRDAA